LRQGKATPDFPPVGWLTQLNVAAQVLRPSTRPEPQKFVLFAQGRTGSTLFGELLASHPDVFFADEILRAKVAAPSLWVAGQRRRHGRRVYGFHVKIYQLSDVQGLHDAGRWLGQMHDRGWKILTLRRRNLLRHVLSNMTIEATGTVHDRSGTAGHRQLHVDPQHVLHWIGIREQVGRDEQQALGDVPHEAFVYEDDLADSATWQSTADRAFAWLGLSAVPVSANLKRRNPTDLSRLISNYDELAAALRGTPYEVHLA
jgi:hypothetical protein